MDIEKEIRQIKMKVDDLTKSNRLLRICINVLSIALLIHVGDEIITKLLNG